MNLGAFATLVVAVAFAALLFWVLRPSNRARFESYARLAVDDDAAQPREER